jgi:double-stranded uracil-DNA glycosylase
MSIRSDSELSHSFPATGSTSPSVLVLGSLPGVRSLQVQQYYAHPRNAFWPIMAELCEFDATLGYEQRIEKIRQCGIALWDVVHSAVRPGSLDADLQADTIIVNDLARLLQAPRLRAIALNGATAAKHFHAQGHTTSAQIIALPSTSPAHAAMRFSEKLSAWRVLKTYFESR